MLKHQFKSLMSIKVVKSLKENGSGVRAVVALVTET